MNIETQRLEAVEIRRRQKEEAAMQMIKHKQGQKINKLSFDTCIPKQVIDDLPCGTIVRTASGEYGIVSHLRTTTNLETGMPLGTRLVEVVPTGTRINLEVI